MSVCLSVLFSCMCLCISLLLSMPSIFLYHWLSLSPSLSHSFFLSPSRVRSLTGISVKEHAQTVLLPPTRAPPNPELPGLVQRVWYVALREWLHWTSKFHLCRPVCRKKFLSVSQDRPCLAEHPWRGWIGLSVSCKHPFMVCMLT